ncbi:FomB family phosphonate monophosphate kinase [Kitasatospora sp. NPDC007106]|uniref:FomB family phosphonate monophosphate kinase n=1 Tax=Kitasatospora sp. NPDC007106 TaxID=3156914 RepID=UPI0033D6670A
MPLDLNRLPLRSSRTVDLNLLKVRIATNLEEFAAYAYFSREAPPGEEPDHEIYCIDLDRDDHDTDELARLADRSLRAKRFRTGYYLNHVFGDPAYLITEGRRSYVFGRRLERTVWPYFVKRILTDFAVDHGYLHLKAAAFVLDGGATLLVGPNAGGKTVFMTQACLAGARFLSNTHLLVRDGYAYGVPSAVRVRRDASFGPLIDRHGLTEHLEQGDFVASPELLFPGEPVDAAPIRNIVITDFDPSRPPGFEEIPTTRSELFLDQFAFAVTTYGLKDDLMNHCGGDVLRFTDVLGAMKAQLAELVGGARCFRSNVDMLDPAARDAVLRELAGTHSAGAPATGAAAGLQAAGR